MWVRFYSSIIKCARILKLDCQHSSEVEAMLWGPSADPRETPQITGDLQNLGC